MADHFSHATISKAGEVDFPLWVKAVAGLLSVFLPIAVGVMAWQGMQIFDMSIRMARMEASLTAATGDKQAVDLALMKANLIEQRIERAERDIQDLKLAN